MILQKVILIAIICVTTWMMPSTAKQISFCPKIEGCDDCEVFPNFTYTTNCRLNKTNDISLSLSFNTIHMTMKCINATELGKFHFQGNNFIQNIKKVEFVNCHFQNRSSVIDFAQKLGTQSSRLKEIILYNCAFLFPMDQAFFNEVSLNIKNLTILKLIDNEIKTLKNKPFNQLRSLTQLYLSFNHINNLNEEVFTNLKRLEILDLSLNNLTKILSKTFYDLQSLKQLSLSHNRISVIEKDAFAQLKNLTVLDISYNELTTIDMYKDVNSRISIFRYCSSLVELVLHHNKINQIYKDWLAFKELSVLDLDSNEITEIFSQDLAFQSTNIYINLMHNRITNIIINPKYLILVTKSEQENIFVDFNFNPIHCDCNLYNFVKYFQHRLEPDVTRVFHFYAAFLTCMEPNRLKGKLVSDIDSEGLLCP